MTNFDFLLDNPIFKDFAQVAVNAEKIYAVDKEASALACRRAMEFAVKWMYSVDESLVMPYQDNLDTLLKTQEFCYLVDDDIRKRMFFIKQLGNQVAHNKRKKIKEIEIHVCLENLFVFLDFVDCCYNKNYRQKSYIRSLLNERNDAQKVVDTKENLELKKLLEENKALKEELTKRRKEQEKTYIPKPLALSEYATRKIYIDAMLIDVNWIEGKNWLNEVEIKEMPNASNIGYCDYVLYDDMMKPLAIIEAKRTCKNVEEGRHQAKLYADYLEKVSGRRPVIFLTNGFETRINDGQFPERKVSSIYSKRDLEKLFNLRSSKESLKDIEINHDIVERYYQQNAIKAVCEDFEVKNKRKALLVMATGSGKTRTVMALCDVLLRKQWIKNILFLADRTSLVIQAHRAFNALLPSLSTANICTSKPDYLANCIFTTYQTMMNVIDEAKDEKGKIFTAGHFDLLVCDEAHRSIYNKYKDIFNYFDAPLVGLTATPKEDIDKNTYEIFNLENGLPTYGYDLAQAVDDTYLVGYKSIETEVKYLTQGIVYDELSDQEKEEYENTFEDENSNMPESISSSALNSWLFNADTIRKVLDVVMKNALHIDYGSKIGKTIIFAKNHKHAEKIFEVFNQEYPHLNGYAQVVDNYINYAQDLIDEFSKPHALPQIAISVDMLDTGIDVPEVLNLVFFKTVKSKAKFWQMIGRGTRTCKGLIDGKDKEKFYIFDFCGNFEFFRMSTGSESTNTASLQSALFNLKALIVMKLQAMQYQTEELKVFRTVLIEELSKKVQELNKENFSVKQHLRYVEIYSNPHSYQNLVSEDVHRLQEEVSPLILPDKGDAAAFRFDALMYNIELAYLEGRPLTRYIKDVRKQVTNVSNVANIPVIMAQQELINAVLHTDYLDRAEINEFEHIREKIRDLVKYIEKKSRIYDTNFTDEIISIEWNDAELINDDLKNYKARAEFYLKQHVDDEVIAKLKTNLPLTSDDIKKLEKVFWNEIGTKEEYEQEIGDKALGIFVRQIVGLDKEALMKAFHEYLNENTCNSIQISFLRQIIEYISRNGILEDFAVLQASPFIDVGRISDIFEDTSIWIGIKRVIRDINSNAVAV